MKISFAHNILANYASQIYITLATILIVPLYVRYMGAEAYGLVGFFTMVQMWFQLLDAGLSPTMARETARFQGGAIDALSLRRLMRTLEGIFIIGAILGGGAMIAGADIIARDWLNVQHLPLAEVRTAIILMAMTVTLRLISSLYRSMITGFEHLVWLSGVSVAVATARFALVIPFFIYIGSKPTDFFIFQMVVAVAELLAMAWKAYSLLPKIQHGARISWQIAPLLKVAKFSLSIAFTSSVWILMTQTDKLVLSKLLPLTEYAYFTLAVLMASGVIFISAPISAALVPRLTKLTAEGNDAEMIRLYRNATQMVGVIAIPAALVLACFSEQILWAWTGDALIARKAAPVLALYALGNGILALGAFPYYLQYAKGDLKLHLIANALFLVVLVPALVWGTWRFGITGAGYAWLGTHLLYLIFYVPKVHGRFDKTLHANWMLHDISAIALVTLAGISLLYLFPAGPQQRLPVAAGIALISVLLVALAATGSSWVRGMVRRRWGARFVEQG